MARTAVQKAHWTNHPNLMSNSSALQHFIIL